MGSSLEALSTTTTDAVAVNAASDRRHFRVSSRPLKFTGTIQTFGLTPSFAVLYLVFFLIIVSVGGLGSLKGTLVASILLGVFDIGGKYLYAEAGGFFIYALTVLILLIKPAGLYGRE